MRISDWSSDVCSSDLQRRLSMDESGASYRISPPHHDARAICDHPPKGRRTMTDLSTPREDAAPFPGGAPDQETHDLMHDLSRMQIWATALACGQTPGAREAMDLCQRTCAYIVGRTFPNANRKAKP